jgi:predicted hotdog family 3-hydroxylacyl-ACP dehydratase
MLNIALERLTPHAGRMRLIARVQSYDTDRIVCEADSHIAPDNPLREAGALAAICGLEYGAQAMAIHGALRAGMAQAPGIGYLVSAHELRWEAERLDQLPTPLVIEAQRILGSASQVSYQFTLRTSAGDVMHGRASVVLSVP